MFYDKQPKEQQDAYKNMLTLVGRLSRLFSESEQPFLYYRAHENIFCKYFEAENNSRKDDSADAIIPTKYGIGLKTWVDGDIQKVAEFGKLRSDYSELTGLDLVKRIAYYRNKRIQTTMNTHGVEQMLYHIVKRVPSAMYIYESAYDMIDIDNISILERGTQNTIYFTDGNHTYNFNLSKHTLYMVFDDMSLLDQFSVEIEADPYSLLAKAFYETQDTDTLSKAIVSSVTPKENQICLRLYSTKADGTKFVAPSSGLNQWNGQRVSYKKDSNGNNLYDENGERIISKITPRNADEFYLLYPVEDRNKTSGFFPPKDTPFNLTLPNGQTISAKVCQQDGKAIMSNPNSALGHWILRDVLNFPERTVITYKDLMEYNIDCVIFTKVDNLDYKITFGVLGTYEKFNNLPDPDSIEENNNWE